MEAKQDETETPEIFICSGGAWHDVPFELERMQPPVHELSGDSRNGGNRGTQYRQRRLSEMKVEKIQISRLI